MDLTKVMEERYSCRKFEDTEVSDDLLRELIRLGSLAPSSNNSKPWKFLVIKSDSILNQMANIVEDKLGSLLKDKIKDRKTLADRVLWYSTFFKNAPSVIVVMAKEYTTPINEILENHSKEDILKLRNHPEIQSLGACVQNILLGAQDMGLGSCWLSGPVIASKRLAELLEESESEYSLAAMVAVGKPAVTKARKVNEEEIPVRFIY